MYFILVGHTTKHMVCSCLERQRDDVHHSVRMSTLGARDTVQYEMTVYSVHPEASNILKSVIIANYELISVTWCT